MKLIDKDAVVAEIERIKKEECPTDSYEGRCKMLWFEQFSSFLDTLEVKEVDLPSNVDEAAESAASVAFYVSPQWRKAGESLFKAGAEWMAEQGDTVDGVVICDDYFTHGANDIVMYIPEHLKIGDKVIVQIRKKEE